MAEDLATHEQAETVASAPGRPGPRGPIAHLRRRILPGFGRLFAGLAIALLLIWLAGRIWTDEHLATQWLWWMPTPLVLAGALLLVGVSKLLEFASLRLGGIMLRPIAIILGCCVFGWYLVAEAGLWLSRAKSVEGEPFTIAYWNLSGGSVEASSVDLDEFGAADLVVLANGRERTALDAAVIAALAPAGDAGELPEDGARPVRYARVLASGVITRDPILAVGEAKLDLPASAWTKERLGTFQNGVAFVTLDTTERLGRDVTFWIVDLPSDPMLHRPRAIAAMLQAAERFAGTVRVPDQLGRWLQTERAATGFPEPDAIIGDFNTPRGSASLAPFRGGFAESHDQAGRGLGHTFIGRYPLWAIDLAFVSRSNRIVSSRVTMPGAGSHRALIVGLDVAEQLSGADASR